MTRYSAVTDPVPILKFDILFIMDFFALILIFKKIALNIIFLNYWDVSAVLNFASQHPSLGRPFSYCSLCCLGKPAASTWWGKQSHWQQVQMQPCPLAEVEWGWGGIPKFWLSHCLDYWEEALLEIVAPQRCSQKQ